MAHADLIAAVFTQACVDALHAARRHDTNARLKFNAVADALQNAYPREVRAVHDAHGIVSSEQTLKSNDPISEKHRT